MTDFSSIVMLVILQTIQLSDTVFLSVLEKKWPTECTGINFFIATHPVDKHFRIITLFSKLSSSQQLKIAVWFDETPTKPCKNYNMVIHSLEEMHVSVVPTVLGCGKTSGLLYMNTPWNTHRLLWNARLILKSFKTQKS